MDVNGTPSSPVPTPENLASTTTAATYDRRALHVLYAANVVQLLQGLIITFVNAVVATTVVSRYSPKSSTNILLGNICFANLVVGVMLSVANVTDGWNEVNLLKTESALAVVNCFVNIASILALTTNTFMGVRNPSYQMSSKNCLKLIFGIWFIVLSLCFVKAIVFAFGGLGYTNVCYTCYAVFEIVALMIFSIAAGLGFVGAFYLILVRRKRTVSDPSTVVPESRNSDFRFFVTTGLFLAVYFACFMLFIFMYLAWLAKPKNVSPGLADCILSLFLMHTIINPIILAVRHKEFRSVMQQVFCCKAAVVALSADGRTRQGNGQSIPMGSAEPVQNGQNGYGLRSYGTASTVDRGAVSVNQGAAQVAHVGRDVSSVPSAPQNDDPQALDRERSTPHPNELPPLRVETATGYHPNGENPISTV